MGHKSPKNYITMLSEFTLPRLKHLKYLKWHNPMESKQTKHQRPQLKSYGGNEVEDDPPTPHTSYTCSTNQEQ